MENQEELKLLEKDSEIQKLTSLVFSQKREKTTLKKKLQDLELKNRYPQTKARQLQSQIEKLKADREEQDA